MDTSILATPTPAGRTSAVNPRLYPDLTAIRASQQSARTPLAAIKPSPWPTNQRQQSVANASQSQQLSRQQQIQTHQSAQVASPSQHQNHQIFKSRPFEALVHSEPLRNVTAIVSKPVNAIEEKLVDTASSTSTVISVDPEQMRRINAKLAFGNLRYNAAYLLGHWWATSSRPFAWLRASFIAGEGLGDLLVSWIVRLLYLLFLFNIVYSFLMLLRPSSQTGTVPVTAHNSSAIAPRLTNLVQAPARSSPTSRPSTPIQISSSAASRMSQSSPSQGSPIIQRSTPTKANANGSPFRSNTPTSNLRAALLSSSDSPKGSPRNAGPLGEATVQEYAMIGRYSPKQVVQDRSKQASDILAMDELLKRSMPAVINSK